MIGDHGDEPSGDVGGFDKTRKQRELLLAERVAWAILALLACAFSILVPIAFLSYA